MTVLFKLLPMLRLDCFRQNMFSVRDELFDYAAAGNISFDDPAYTLLRHQMNGMIRYGHQLTLFRVLVTWAVRAISGESNSFQWHDAWERALANLQSKEVRQQLEHFHSRSAEVAARHLVTGSLFLWLLLAMTALVLSLRGAALGARQIWRTASRTILVWGPIDQRVIEEEAVCALA